jgi:hypothetical protein
MGAPRFIPAERRLQRKFRFASLLLLIPLSFLLLVASDTRWEGPDRVPGPERLAPIAFQPLRVPPGLAGAWRLRMADSRFGGLSALAWDGHGLVALTDSGTMIDLPRPARGAIARIRDLPAGPGPDRWKRFRDSEALVPVAAGWWVGFENRHSLWLYDRSLRRPLRTVSLRGLGWRVNKGVEAMVADGDGLLILPESGREVVRVRSSAIQRLRLESAGGAPADAARLADGTVLVAVRSVTLGGIRNRIARLERSGRGYRLRTLREVPLGMFDNVEGLAAEPLTGGAVRLWLLTDNDFHAWRATRLIAVDLPAGTRH